MQQSRIWGNPQTGGPTGIRSLGWSALTAHFWTLGLVRERLGALSRWGCRASNWRARWQAHIRFPGQNSPQFVWQRATTRSVQTVEFRALRGGTNLKKQQTISLFLFLCSLFSVRLDVWGGQAPDMVCHFSYLELFSNPAPDLAPECETVSGDVTRSPLATLRAMLGQRYQREDIRFWEKVHDG